MQYLAPLYSVHPHCLIQLHSQTAVWHTLSGPMAILAHRFSTMDMKLLWFAGPWLSEHTQGRGICIPELIPQLDISLEILQHCLGHNGRKGSQRLEHRCHDFLCKSHLQKRLTCDHQGGQEDGQSYRQKSHVPDPMQRLVCPQSGHLRDTTHIPDICGSQGAFAKNSTADVAAECALGYPISPGYRDLYRGFICDTPAILAMYTAFVYKWLTAKNDSMMQRGLQSLNSE